MIDYPRLVSEALAVFLEDPVFRTGDNALDSWLTFALYIGLFISFAGVVSTVATRYKARCDAKTARWGKVRWKIVHGLIGFAVVSFAIVNILRWEHRRLKVATFGVLRTVEKVKEHVGTESWEEWASRGWTDLQRGSFSPTYETVPKPVLGRLPWMPMDWSHTTSVWDYFKLLVGDGRTNFWTRQWYMGFFAWGLYVSSKSKLEHRTLVRNASPRLIIDRHEP